MKVEIWSDVMCPFCYIGKRRFEAALGNFKHAADIKVEWKSFQLNPDMKTEPGKNINDYLAEVKGWSPEQARQMNEQVTRMAAGDGLDYHLDQAIVANSRDAHRLIQFAKTNGRGDEMEEALFNAYFHDGRNTADHEVLVELATASGLDPAAAAEVLTSGSFNDEVDQDIYQAMQIGVRGVPYFVFDDKYAVSGAQPAETFLGALTRSWSEWKVTTSKPVVIAGIDGASCEVDDSCS